MRAHDLCFSPDIADVLLASMDVLRAFTAAAAAGENAATAKSNKLLQRMREELEAVARGAKSKPEGPSEPAADAIHEAKPAPSSTTERTLRVDVQKLDRLLDLTGEIAIARGRTTRLLDSGSMFPSMNWP